MGVADLKHVMKPSICFFKLLCPANMAFSTKVVSVSTDMTTDFALSRIISRATINVNLKLDCCFRHAMANLNGFFKCWPINYLVYDLHQINNLCMLNYLFDTVELLRNTSILWRWHKMCVKLLLKEFFWQVFVTNVSVVMFIPAFQLISRYNIAKNIYPAHVQGIAFSQRAIWIGHMTRMSRFHWLTCFLCADFTVDNMQQTHYSK